MPSNVINLAEARQRRSRNPHQSLFAMLDAEFPSGDSAQQQALFARFGLDVDVKAPSERIIDIWHVLTGRMARHITMLAYTPDLFDRCVGKHEPHYTRYLKAVLRDDRETVCQLAAELRILESIRPVA